MTYFVAVFDSVDPVANPIRGAGLFTVGKPSLTEEEMITRDKPLMVGYGSSTEAAMLALRAGLSAALGAVELEIATRRGIRIRISAEEQQRGRDRDEYQSSDEDGLTDIKVIDLSDPDDEEEDEDDDENGD